MKPNELMKPIGVAFALVLVLAAGPVWAQKDKGGELRTSVNFDSLSLKGKYLMSGEGIASVQSEKRLLDLMGARSQFNDRIRAQKSRHLEN